MSHDTIPFEYRSAVPESLKLGFHADHVDFDHRPYAERSPEARADYDRLLVSIYHHGIRMPIITHQGHVLIGQRRVEIARRLYPQEPLRCVEILEDVSKWSGYDVFERLPRLKMTVGEIEY